MNKEESDMKGKRFIVAIVGVLLASAEMPAQEEGKTHYERVMAMLQEGGRAVPDFEQVPCITLETSPTRWEGRFFPNGSAILSYGSVEGLNPQAAAPKGSFSFEDVYRLLAPRLKTDEVGMNVYLHVAGDDINLAWGLPRTEENKEIARKLMRGLSEKALPLHNGVSTKESFEELLATRPLVPGDEPTPSVVSRYSRRVARAAEGDTKDWMRIKEAMRQMARERRKETGMPDALTDEEERAVAKDFARRRADYGLPPKMAEDGPGETPSPSIRLWLYVGALALLCAAAALWIVRRKR